MNNFLLFLSFLSLQVFAEDSWDIDLADLGVKYLEKKKKDPEVVQLKSGVMYKVLKAGDGKELPLPDTPVEYHYTGTHVDGEKFDSSYDRGQPITLAANQVIPGVKEILQLMVVGDKWEIYIPSELGYGARGAGANIPANSTLVFVQETLAFKGATKPTEAKPEERGEL